MEETGGEMKVAAKTPEPGSGNAIIKEVKHMWRLRPSIWDYWVQVESEAMKGACLVKTVRGW